MLGRVALLHNGLLFFGRERLRVIPLTRSLAALVAQSMAFFAPAAQGAAADAQHATRFVAPPSLSR